MIRQKDTLCVVAVAFLVAVSTVTAIGNGTESASFSSTHGGTSSVTNSRSNERTSSTTLSRTPSESTSSSTSRSRTFTPSVELTPAPTSSPSLTLSDVISHTISLAASETTTLVATPTDTLLSSGSSTATMSDSASIDLPVSPCRDLPATVSFQVIYPDKQAPVTTDFILEASVVSTTGYQITVNITSCHIFGQQFIDSTFSSDVSDKSKVAEKVENKATDDFSTGFIDVLNVDGNFVSIAIESYKSAVMKIGPNQDFALYTEPETITMSWRPTTFFPPSSNVLSAAFVIQPLSSGSSDESRVSDTSSLVISIISIAVSNPTTAALVGKVEMLAQAMDCPIFLTDQALPIDQNPTGLGFGNERKLYYHVGSVLVNPFIVFSLITVHFLMVLVVAGLRSIGSSRRGNFESAMATLRYPGFSLVPIVFFYQGTITSAVTIFLYSASAFYSFAAMCVLLLAMVTPVACFLRVTKRHFFALRASTETPEARTSAVVRFLFGVGEWIDRGRRYRGFATRYSALFDEFRPKRQWFLTVELCFLYLYGIMNAVAPKTNSGCVAVSIAETITLWIYLIAIVGQHPHHNIVTYVMYILIAVSQLLASLLITSSHIIDDEQQKNDTMYSATILLLVSVSLTMLKMLHDFAIIGFTIRFGKERAANVAAWKVGAKRKVRVTRLAKQREEDIQVLLENEIDDDFQPSQDHDYASELDSLEIPDHDEQEPQQIASSVPPVNEPTAPSREQKEVLYRTTGMTKEELWKVL